MSIELERLELDEAVWPVPDPPLFLDERAALEAWDVYWRSGVPARLGVNPDDSALLRWAQLTNDWHDLHRRYMAAPTGEYRDGAPKANPLAARLNRIEVALAQLEEKFGMTPRSRKALGVDFVEIEPEEDESESEEPENKPIELQDYLSG